MLITFMEKHLFGNDGVNKGNKFRVLDDLKLSICRLYVL